MVGSDSLQAWRVGAVVMVAALACCLPAQSSAASEQPQASGARANVALADQNLTAGLLPGRDDRQGNPGTEIAEIRYQASGADHALPSASTPSWHSADALLLSVVSLVLGAIALLVWGHQRDACYLFYALAEVLWSVRTAGNSLGDRLMLPWPQWGALMTALYCGAFASMSYFGLALVRRTNGPCALMVRYFVLGSVLALVLSFGLDFGQPQWERYWRIANLSLCAACAAVVLAEARRSRSPEALVLGCVCAVVLAADLRDWFVFTAVRPDSTTGAWMTYAWTLFGATMAWLLASRLHRATRAQARHAHELAQRLSTQAATLARSYSDQRRQSEQVAAAAERRRVLHDMHDGVGHELLGALMAARGGSMTLEALAEQIQRAMDHLKLTVDALQEGSHDVATVLGLLRYRLAPRLQDAGIAINWQVSAIPELEGWEPRRSRDLQLLLYEAFTNLIAHSGASRAGFEARFDKAAQSLFIRLVDDGKGFGANSRHGSGLASMRTRAERLQAELSLSCAASPDYSGACVALIIPCETRCGRDGAEDVNAWSAAV